MWFNGDIEPLIFNLNLSMKKQLFNDSVKFLRHKLNVFLACERWMNVCKVGEIVQLSPNVTIFEPMYYIAPIIHILLHSAFCLQTCINYGTFGAEIRIIRGCIKIINSKITFYLSKIYSWFNCQDINSTWILIIWYPILNIESTKCIIHPRI